MYFEKKYKYKYKKKNFIIALFILLLSISIVGCSQQLNNFENKAKNLTNKAEKSINKSSSGNKKSTVRSQYPNIPDIKSTKLYHIFKRHPFGKSGGFPRVAIRIKKAPSFHKKSRVTSRPSHKKGCWILNATVWKNRKSHKEVGPFKWCLHKDGVFKVTILHKARNYLENPNTALKSHIEKTTNKPTSGPYPPRYKFPRSPKAHKWFGTLKGPLNDRTYDSFMMYSVIYQLGVSLPNPNEYRLWFQSVPSS